ncbi:MAG: AAA family ATPase [bacterium]
MKKLPIGIQTFEEIINNNYLYVDKTKQIYDVINSGKAFFISRPRRFGKSLLCSTLEEIFKGNKELFKGLWIYDSDYKWDEHPVIRIDMSSLVTDSPEEFKESLNRNIKNLASKHGIKIDNISHPKDRIKYLIEELSKKNKIVIIIDEYDKPILDNISDPTVAAKIRSILRGFYSTFKESDQYLKFVFLTGVTRFSKISIFSGLNNLYDLTFEKEAETLLGYTQKEVDFYFEERIKQFASEQKTSKTQILLQLKDWYNGYSFFDGEKKVYNPFSILLALKSFNFRNYWFETGTPTFLLDLIKEKGFDHMDPKSFEATEIDLSNFEIETLPVKTTLFQTGYLTIIGFNQERRRYYLDYPNFEVKESFLELLLCSMTTIEQVAVDDTFHDLANALKNNNLEEFISVLKNFYSQIPYTIQNTNEKYYQSIFFIILRLLGIKVEVEITTNMGRIDALVTVKNNLYIFEFKINQDAKKALLQIMDKKYYEGYLKRNKIINLVGINFDTKQKNIANWEHKKL